MAAPAMDRAAPVSATQITRGSRTDRMMEPALTAGIGLFMIAAQITLTVSLTGMLTLPTHTHTTAAVKRIAVNSR